MIKTGVLAAIPQEIAPKDVRVFGTAPKVKFKQMSESFPRSYVLVFDKGDDIIAGLNDFVAREKIDAGHVSAIGALKEAAVAFYDSQTKMYQTIYVDQHSELVSLSGNISRRVEKHVVHVHCVVSLRTGQTLGGHLFYASVWPTVELYLFEAEHRLDREVDEESCLALIKL